MKPEEMNARWLRETYFFGIPMTDNYGNPIPDSVLEFYIKKAIGEIEDNLKIKVLPQIVIERKDFRIENWKNFSTLSLNCVPVREIVKVKMKTATHEWVEIPKEWITIHNPMTGIISFIPVLGSIEGIRLQSIVSFFVPVLTGAIWFPALWEIEYKTGFEDIPEDIADAIGMIASIQLFNIFGDIVIGAGIANISMGIDGISLSVGTTSSAENAVYSARIREYERQLEKFTFPVLKQKYRKISFSVL